MHWSFLAVSCTGLIRSCVLMRCSVRIHRTGLMRNSLFLHRAVLLVLRRSWGVRLRRIRLGLCLSCVRFFRGVLVL